MLKFALTTSLADDGIFSNVIQQDFDNNWLFKIGGIGKPKPEAGFSLNLVSTEESLGYRRGERHPERHHPSAHAVPAVSSTIACYTPRR